MKKVITEISMMRRGGKGVLGSIENAKHHAEAMLPYIAAMRHVVGELGFAKWKQGHAVHEFTNTEGQRYTLRPIIADANSNNEGSYIGVRLSLRVSRSDEYRLADITDVADAPALLAMMSMLAKPKMGRNSRLMNGCSSAE